MPNGIPPWHTPAPYTGMYNPEEFERQREGLFNYMSQNEKLRKETYDANAQTAKQNWDAYNDYMQEMSKLKQELSDLVYNERVKFAEAYDGDTPYQTPLPMQQKIGQIRNQIQTLDAANFQTAPSGPATPSAALSAGAATEPTAVGTYNQGLDSGSPFGYREPAAAASAQPFGTDSAAAPTPLVASPVAAQETIPYGLGGVVEGATAGDVIGAGTTITPESLAAAGGFLPEGSVGGQVPATINAYEGLPGVQTPGGRGFANYYDMYGEMARDMGEGRIGAGTYEPWEIQGIMGNQFGQADSLREYLNPQRGFAGGQMGRGAMYRGLMTQKVDMGQGVQDYQVRRDAYGNITSYTPGKEKVQPWQYWKSKY